MAGKRSSSGKEDVDKAVKKQRKSRKQPVKKKKVEKKGAKKTAPEDKKPAPVLQHAKRQEFPVAQRLQMILPFTCSTIFPPTLYTNVEYSKGICVSRDMHRTIIPKDYMVACYGQYNYPYSPWLPQRDVWSHKAAAVEASKHGFPLNVFRYLGTITRTVSADKPPPLRKPGSMNLILSNKKRSKLTKAQAKKQALLELPEQHTQAKLAARMAEIQTAWNQHWSSDNLPKMWDPEHGHLLPQFINDENHVPLRSLVEWNFENLSKDKVVELYHGLRTVQVDTRSVLKSLAELQSPQGLYEIPLVMTYPLLRKINDGTYEIQIGVYAHRLLPEVLVEQDLLKVMTALDRDSFTITEPLHVPPTPSCPTFASAKFPKLVYQHAAEEEEKVIDLTLGESTRETSETLSAFTVPGLLKLWEHAGNDTTEWPQLEPVVRNKLMLSLLLHQQHALCWMRQMESLKGFGINSILWEEREWADGGKYYYSPALGQLRLERPATMHGGIVSDEMGLGKTIMILALIVTTLDELKLTGSHTTLIVVPPALMWQWKAEINKAAPQLQVQLYNAHTGVFEPESKHEPDIVLTTYQALEHAKTSKRLQDRVWGRIVLDEMQEIRSSATMIAKSCDKLSGTRRWMLSGTPLFDGIEDLKGELNFLSLEPYAAKSEDGFFDFSITNHWHAHSQHGLDTLKVLGLLLLRRSKTMTICETGAPLMGLKPMTVEFVPVPQSPYERALYCFLEYIVATQLADDVISGADHRLCLRLLRELCISPMLLAGGVGVTSELTKLNNMVKLYNRQSFLQQMDEDLTPDEHLEALNGYLEEAPQTDLTRGLTNGRMGTSRSRTLSCAEAIRYLSQVQAKVQTSEDFVSDLQLGAGGGMAKRDRATKSVEERMTECQEKLSQSQKEVKTARAAKARSHWHLALERITTGQVPLAANIHRSVAALWRWRAAVQERMSGDVETTEKLPTMLVRGWRPSAQFIIRDLSIAHPDYGWTHPFALALHNIPQGVEPEELHAAIAETLETTKHKIVVKSNGRAIVQFQDAVGAKLLRHHAKRGIAIKTNIPVPFVEGEFKDCEAVYEQAKNENNVYPTMGSRRRVKLAQKKMEAAQRGLLIVLEDQSAHVRLLRAKDPPRSLYPGKAAFLYNNLKQDIEDANQRLATHVPVVNEHTKLVRNLERAAEVPDEIKQMSSFESLEAMSFKEYDKTSCVICMGVLGASDPKCTDESNPGLVGLTSCGHLFCTKCICDYMANQSASHSQPKCPTCRKDIEKNTLVNVDPSLSRNLEQKEAKQRSKAKSVIQKAAKMLEESNGQLDQDMWLQLFLSIDPPSHVSQRGDPRVSAIPKEVISFFRAATCFEHVHNNPSALPSLEPAHGLSSKMQALLRDLPRTERSVVFTSSRAAVKHLMALLEYHTIGRRAVFSGQNPEEAETAVQEWKDSIVTAGRELQLDEEKKGSLSPVENPLVLIVQAGAAASGLTLTAACKMFFMEPFVRQEEEHQAYARCHRYGQVDPVHAKVYFSPVSVESRLLEWRKQVASAAARSDSNTKVVYTDIMEEVDDDSDEDEDLNDTAMQDEKDSDEEDTDQTLFLLGLQ